MEAKVTQALVNELLETLKDGQKGYAEAMTDVEDPQLKETFKKYAAQRSEFITELEDQMFKLNLKPEEESSVTGTVHRAWINLKGALTSKDNKSILNECERGEDYAKAAYNKAAEAQDLPADLKSVIQKQASGIREAHDTIRALRDSAK
ncbi:PA2169 family four-helix-bundle protein [Hymenobacter lutimineralis]|uniref:PA2169 family four-helix-bundle protein n=1 Tax=Hymenobacter lutimineralis TaxID=2606448 RepID=A0A5D6VIC0_9BACT|nr:MULTISPECIES: PA2169 family four-helix-bundle protein [Hymenobacter]QIX60017.1 PA2169 family four-helix-bundle protein [Hymenobacter sp. BT18]TYZ14549.1 PA2169 family four-helix-bundle protein [Hymenobacter lutimineralis]